MMKKMLHEYIDDVETENINLMRENELLKSALWGACTALVVKSGIEVSNDNIDKLCEMMKQSARESLE